MTEKKAKTYYALTNISLDGEEYAIGAVVPLTEKQAAQIADAVTTKPLEHPAVDDGRDGPLTQDQVVAAIGQLDTDDITHWTKSGKPQIDTLENVLEASVSGALRDAAWAEFEATAG